MLPPLLVVHHYLPPVLVFSFFLCLPCYNIWRAMGMSDCALRTISDSALTVHKTTVSIKSWCNYSYKIQDWYSWEHRNRSRVRSNTFYHFWAGHWRKCDKLVWRSEKNTKEHTPFSKSWRWFNHFQCWDTFQSITITGETAATDYVTPKRIDYNLESNECRVYIQKEMINLEGSCFFWEHSFSHTFSSIDCKQCLNIQLLKF